MNPALEILPPGSAWQPWLGVFETLRVERGRALFVEAHWRSLQRACAALGLLRGDAVDFRAATGALPQADGRWRWLVGADGGGARHFFQAERLPDPRQNFALVRSPFRVGAHNWDARFKTFSYLTHWQARRAQPPGTEALLRNERGEIASGAFTNLFWVRDDELFTPAENCGCRAGVVRGWILQEKPDTHLVRARPAALDAADEIFLTNSLLGLCPVTRWRERTLAPGPLTRALRQRYRLACQREIR